MAAVFQNLSAATVALAFAAALAGFACDGWAKPLMTSDLHLKLKGFQTFADDSSSPRSRTLCEKFARQLTTQAPGHGLFSQASCTSDQAESSWFLSLKQLDETTASFTWSHGLSCNRKNKSPQCRRQLGRPLEIPMGNEELNGFLESPLRRNVLATALLARLPFGVRINPNEPVKRKIESPEETTKVPYQPTRWTLYRVNYDEKQQVFRPRVLGRAKLSLSSDNTDSTSLLHRAVKKHRWHRWRWQVTLDTGRNLESSKEKLVFARPDAPGKWRQKTGERLTKISTSFKKEFAQPLIAKAGQAMTNLFFKTLHSGFIGIRYGLPLFGSGLISKTSIAGIFGEIRSGPFDGMRGYADVWPKTTAQENGEEVSLEGQRAIAGWSLKLPFQNGRHVLDLTPKLGVWSFKTRLHAQTATAKKTRAISFEVDQATSFGLEAGAETSGRWYLARLWGSRNFGVELVGATNDNRVTTTRAGFDTLIRGPDWLQPPGQALSFMIFGVFEKVDLVKPGEKDVESGEISAHSLIYQQTYTGGGIAYSW